MTRNFPIRLTMSDKGIEAAAHNTNNWRCPFILIVDIHAPGNVLETNVKEGTNEFRWLVKAARKHVRP